MVKKSFFKILLIILLFLLLLGAGGVFVWWHLSSSEKTPKKRVKVQNSIEQNLVDIGPLYNLDPITVTLKTKNKKYNRITITLSLELDCKLLVYELEAQSRIIKDKIISIFQQKTLEDLYTEIGRENLRDEIKASLNAILTDGQIKNVYIINIKETTDEKESS